MLSDARLLSPLILLCLMLRYAMSYAMRYASYDMPLRVARR